MRGFESRTIHCRRLEERESLLRAAPAIVKSLNAHAECLRTREPKPGEVEAWGYLPHETNNQPIG